MSGTSVGFAEVGSEGYGWLINGLAQHRKILQQRTYLQRIEKIFLNYFLVPSISLSVSLTALADHKPKEQKLASEYYNEYMLYKIV